MPISVKITDSNRKDKKYMAIFRLHKGGRIFKITHFGGKNYSDYTKQQSTNKRKDGFRPRKTLFSRNLEE